MGLNNERLKQLEFACILHDIGKIAIPKMILNKTSPLTDQEFLMIKQHPTIGYDILKEIHFLEDANRIILQHHERIDGKGYPYGLTAKDLLLESRILSVADAYDAMSSQRVYRKGTMDIASIEAEFQNVLAVNLTHRW